MVAAEGVVEEEEEEGVGGVSQSWEELEVLP